VAVLQQRGSVTRRPRRPALRNPTAEAIRGWFTEGAICVVGTVRVDRLFFVI
jgi:hypothetical protein